jgi:Trp operon repressor
MPAAAIFTLLASPEFRAGFAFLLEMGPRAIQLVQDLTDGKLTEAEVQQRWNEAVAQVKQGNAAWDDAGKP